MKIKSSRLSILITLISTVIIITIGYKILAYAGAYFLTNDDEIRRLSADNATTYVFYSQSEDYGTLYPWNYNYDTTSFSQYFGSEAVASEYFDIWELYNGLAFYFYRIIPKEIQPFLLSENITLSERMNYNSIEQDLSVKSVNNELIFFYSKDLIIYAKTYNLSFSFNQASQILSFQIKPLMEQKPSKSYLENSIQILSDNINPADNNSILFIFYDIVNMAGLFDSYHMTHEGFSEYNNVVYDESVDTALNEKMILSEIADKSSLSNTSYQLASTEDEFLIILLENNVVLHFDPVTSMISGFNLSESYVGAMR